MKQILLAMLIFSGMLFADGKLYSGALDVYPGWNLVPDSDMLDSSSTNSLAQADIQGSFIYYAPIGKYADKSKTSNNQGFTSQDLNLITSVPQTAWNNQAKWIFVKENKQMVIRENTYDRLMYPLSDMMLFKGWNLITVTGEMWSANLNSLGNCQVLKVAAFDASHQKWNVINLNSGSLSSGSSEDLRGKGLAIKVANDCVPSSASQPPSLPS